MSTIVGIQKDGVIAIAGDGATVWNGTFVETRTMKVRRLNRSLAIGVAGDARTPILLWGSRVSFGADVTSPEDVWQTIRTVLEKDGFRFTPSGEDGVVSCGSCFIFALGDLLFEMDGSGAYHTKPEMEPAVIGSGSELARGAIDACIHLELDLSAVELACLAVAMARRRDINSGGDIRVFVRAPRRRPQIFWASETEALARIVGETRAP